MKRFLLLLLMAVLIVSCQTAPPAARSTTHHSCCATQVQSAAALTDKSLYQLESTWTNDVAQPVKLEELRGRIQIVAMFFTSCTYACPIIVHDLQRIEAALPEATRDKVHFTLVTIDPEHDTTNLLHGYRLVRQLPAERWTLLRGTPDDTLELAAVLGVKFKREASGQFAHSNLITLLNSEGEIVHQVAGLNHDIGETVKRISALGKE